MYSEFLRAFTFVNKCEFIIWSGILSNAGIVPLLSTGFALENGGSRVIPSSWEGCSWGRTACTGDSTGKSTCQTGDCGSGKLESDSGGAAPPTTLAEFTLDGGGGKDFYDVSLVDRYNLPMLVVPQVGSGDNCTRTGCVVDLNGSCPPELRVTTGEDVACKSACGAFGTEQYCCSGTYGTSDVCKPSRYSLLFKHAMKGDVEEKLVHLPINSKIWTCGHEGTMIMEGFTETAQEYSYKNYRDKGEQIYEITDC